MSKQLKDTLNLPRTQFPMRGDLPKREPERLARWEAEDLYHAVQEKNKDGNTFILHDGPPYANGNIHMGHALNKLLKDIILRYKSMRGYRTPYVPGWDCHGLPIEQQILKQIGEKIHDMDPIELRNMCADYANNFIDIQREQFKRLGILGEWETPYKTLNHSYEVGILRCLEELCKRGLIEKGHKAVHWDPVFRTALAEAEIEYQEHTSPSVYVAFELNHVENYEFLAPVKGKRVQIVIWTTTPWTLPANMGVSLHPEFDYVALVDGDNAYIVAKELAEGFQKACHLEDATVGATFKATGLDRGTCKHPIFPEKDSLIMLGEHVTLEAGTGCVHTAPGHGADDFIIGKAYGLAVFVPVDDKGCYTSDYPEMEGTFVFDANDKIVKKLVDEGKILAVKPIKHEYPHSWRSKKPIIFRATEQWFMKLEEGGVRSKSLDAIDNDVQWIPKWGHDRIRSMVERRPEWCISRQRSWGVPIPSVKSKKTGQSLLLPEVIDAFIEFVDKEGTDAWFTRELTEMLPASFVGPNGETAADLEKESDILDVWFDSGASHIACVEMDKRLTDPPVDLYLEGSDQHRGWFQAALLLGIGARDRAPFKSVLTHGFVLDEKGYAMSKSMGNVVSPLDMIAKYGSDILRLWVNSIDFTNDMGISDNIMQNIARAYRDVRNTLRFQLGNLYDFDYSKDAVPFSKLEALDAWALHKLAELVEDVTAAYENYEFHRAYNMTTQFCTVTLSALYHDILKDRLYTYGADWKERRSAQTVIYHIFDSLTRLMAPVLAFTCDEARAYLAGDCDFGDKCVHLEDWPIAPEEWKSETAEEIDKLLNKVRPMVNEKLEALRQEKVIGKSIDAALTISSDANDALLNLMLKYEKDLPELFIVSSVSLVALDSEQELTIEAKHAEGERCPRSLRWVPTLQESEYGPVSPRCARALANL
ncbi:MAG: isoleucine--tRNA ligase [Opitutales bacterium]|nr:isoleucine--tRNA ligase [Opitutales bacterium]